MKSLVVSDREAKVIRSPLAGDSRRCAPSQVLDPMAADTRSSYDQRIVAERVGGSRVGWGA